MFLMGHFEKSLLVWHKARKIRENVEEVNDAIENVGQTILTSLEGCFGLPSCARVITELLEEYGCVDDYLEKGAFKYCMRRFFFLGGGVWKKNAYIRAEFLAT